MIHAQSILKSETHFYAKKHWKSKTHLYAKKKKLEKQQSKMTEVNMKLRFHVIQKQTDLGNGSRLAAIETRYSIEPLCKTHKILQDKSVKPVQFKERNLSLHRKEGEN